MEKDYSFYEKEFSHIMDRIRKDVAELDKIEHVSKNLSNEIDIILNTIEPLEPVAYINYQYRKFSKIKYVMEEYNRLVGRDGIEKLNRYREELKNMDDDLNKIEDYDYDLMRIKEEVEKAYAKITNSISRLVRVRNYLMGDVGAMKNEFYVMNNANKELSKYLRKIDVKTLLGNFSQERDYVTAVLQENLEFFREILDPEAELRDIIEHEKPSGDSLPSSLTSYRNSLEWLKDNIYLPVEKAERELERIQKAKNTMKETITALEGIIAMYNIREANPLSPILREAYQYLDALERGEEEIKSLVEEYKRRAPTVLEEIDREIAWVNERL